MHKGIFSNTFVGSIKNSPVKKKVKEMIDMIAEDGWFIKSHNGTSHRQYAHATKKGKVTINGKPSDDLDDFVVLSILKQAQISKDVLRKKK